MLCDPLSGPSSSRLLRGVTRLYGPTIRLVPWLWGVTYHVADSRRAMGLLRRTLLALADRPVADAVASHHPAAIVSFHPLTGGAAVKASRAAGRHTPVVTVVTDLVTAHAAWRYEEVDQVVVPTAAARWQWHLDGFPADRCVEIGLPVTSDFGNGPLRGDKRADLRRSLGLSDERFVVVLTGGGEGSGGLARRVRAIVRECDDIDVVVICGRNRRLERTLGRLAATAGGRLTVRGFVDNMADWLRCADVVVTNSPRQRRG